MSKPTLQQQYLKALKDIGETVTRETPRYTVLTRKRTVAGRPVETESYWFLGSSGSVRFGRTRGTSIPLDDQFKRVLLSWANADPLDSLLKGGTP